MLGITNVTMKGKLHETDSEKSRFEKKLLLHLSTIHPSSVRHFRYLLEPARSPAQVVSGLHSVLTATNEQNESSLLRPLKE